jgi:hypothetical protein
LASSVWLGHSKGRAWSCEQCRAKKGLRNLRGNCGGPFKKGLPLLQHDEEGGFVPGYRVAPDCGEDYSDLKIRSCPVAGANRLSSIIQAYHRHRAGLIKISETYPKPSCALLEAIDVLHSNTEEAIYRAHQRSMKEARHGNQ